MQRKAIFDTVRKFIGRGFSQSEVDVLDRAIDMALDSAAQPDSPEPDGRRSAVSDDGVALIRSFEGCARRRADGMVEAYPDPASSLARSGWGSGAPWTIGWGATGPGIGPGTVWSQAQCDARLIADIARHAAEVVAAIGDAPTSQAQFDALVSFHYNTGAIARATLTRRHRAGDHAGAAGEFGRWTRAGGCCAGWCDGAMRNRASTFPVDE